jgi:hypothetical protein
MADECVRRGHVSISGSRAACAVRIGQITRFSATFVRTADSRIPVSHPIHRVTDAALTSLSDQFDGHYANEGRPSIAPERLLRVLAIQALDSVRSERQFMKQLKFICCPVWYASTFSKEP